ncbi:MAG: Uma2 family endonuclease [Chloroflexota bacterium]|nr:Uma2 family endonuclease [Chloroflexota bacterium]
MQPESISVPHGTLLKLAELIVPLTAPVVYRESDGEPMAETDVHRDEMTDALIHPLKERYRADPLVYVSGNLLLYYEEGNPYASVAPDVFVAFGIKNEQRRTYKLWQEGKAPDVVFELSSESTRNKDLSEKRLLYERLGVREYFIFDPLREYLRPPLQGFRLGGAYYTPLAAARLADDNWELPSEVLGLTLRTAGSTLRLYDAVAGRYLLNRAEEAEARRQAEREAVNEAAARRQAEARLQAADAEIISLRARLAERNDHAKP